MRFFQIAWENRYNSDVGNDCIISVDCTDCKFCIDKGKSKKSVKKAFWSYKFRKSGLRYEVGVCIKTGYIVWIHGPFPCGRYNDVTIFRHCLLFCLDQGERVECDDGYFGEAPEKCVVPKHAWARQSHLVPNSGAVRARHETINKRIKDFECMKQFFRQSIEFHSVCFRAVAVLTQLSMENGKPAFQVEY